MSFWEIFIGSLLVVFYFGPAVVSVFKGTMVEAKMEPLPPRKSSLAMTGGPAQTYIPNLKAIAEVDAFATTPYIWEDWIEDAIEAVEAEEFAKCPGLGCPCGCKQFKKDDILCMHCGHPIQQSKTGKTWAHFYPHGELCPNAPRNNQTKAAPRPQPIQTIQPKETVLCVHCGHRIEQKDGIINGKKDPQMWMHIQSPGHVWTTYCWGKATRATPPQHLSPQCGPHMGQIPKLPVQHADDIICLYCGAPIHMQWYGQRDLGTAYSRWTHSWKTQCPYTHTTPCPPGTKPAQDNTPPIDYSWLCRCALQDV